MTSVPISHQIAAVRRFAEREGTPDILAAHATLSMIATYADGLRELIRFLRTSDIQPGEVPSSEERDHLMAHPAMKELVKAFPEAVLTSVKPIELPPAPADEHTEEEQGALL
jgi:hypothetical protein